MQFDDIEWHWRYMELFDLWTSTYNESMLEDLSDISHFNLRREFSVRMYESGINDYTYDGSFQIYGEITSLTIIPEPTTFSLFYFGILMFLKRRR